MPGGRLCDRVLSTPVERFRILIELIGIYNIKHMYSFSILPNTNRCPPFISACQGLSELTLKINTEEDGDSFFSLCPRRARLVQAS